MVSRIVGVYAIRNEKTGEQYVGASQDCAARFRSHAADLRRGRCVSKLLQAAWDRDGAESFTLRLLEQVDCPPRRCSDSGTLPDALAERERHWIHELKPAYNRKLSRAYPIAAAVAAGKTIRGDQL